MHLPPNKVSFYCFVFGATLVQYNLHYLVKTEAVKDSARLSWSLKNKNVHVILVAIGVILIIYSLFSFRIRHYVILLVMGMIALIYSFPVLPGRKRIKDFGLLKILTLALLWTLVTVWFPVVNLSFYNGLFWFIFFKRFIFMFVLCLLFDMRDAEIDRDHNIHTIAVRVGLRNSYYISYFTLGLFAILCLVQFYFFGDAPVLFATLISAVATFITIEFTKTIRSDFIYLAGIDGMMLLQASLIYLAIKF